MNQNRNTPPDPRDYDMYSAFRTREKGEARRQQRQTKKSSYFDAYAHRAEEEQKAAREARRRQAQADAAYRRQYEEPQNQARQNLQTPNRGSQGQNRITYGQGLSNPSRPRVRTEVPLPGETPTPHRSKRNTGAQTYGTRVQNDGDDAYRYGYHSSYRTSDGRILDGFDAKGRPIYRDASASGSAAVVRRTEFSPETADNYRPPRRVRVETLADTDAKPFPLKIVLTVVFCTSLVMAVLFAFMRLNEYTNELSLLSYYLSNYRSEANALQAELVRREDLLSIEQTASEVLGMVKVDVLTKKYVTIENEDKTEVVSKLEEEARKRTSVEIDLDTGKPIGKQNLGSGYIPPSEATDRVTEPVTEEMAETTAEPVTKAPDGTDPTDSTDPDSENS